MLDLLMDFIEKDDPRGKEYRGLDWSVEYDLAIQRRPERYPNGIIIYEKERFYIAACDANGGIYHYTLAGTESCPSSENTTSTARCG